MDLMLGGDLRYHLLRRNFTEPELKIISAQISLGLNHLHSLGIVHRDIKPDNILLDEKGNAHISDFNVAAYIGPINKLNSVCGTQKYMAPEMTDTDSKFLFKGYDCAVDWWSLGITLYELATKNKPTFNNDYVLELNDLKNNTKEFIDLITNLLNKNPNERIGHMKSFDNTGYKKLVNHNFYHETNFGDIEKKRISPIFIPNVICY